MINQSDGNMKKRRQHYVWRKYLSTWAKDDLIWCHRDHKIFQPNLMGVSQERDFYKTEQLTAIEIDFIRKLAIEKSKGRLQNFNEGWISTFGLVFRVQNWVEANHIHDPEIDNLLDETIHNYEENYHEAIEIKFEAFLNSLLKQDTSFYNTEDECMSFVFCLCTQYMRTKKIEDNVCASFGEIIGIDVRKTWRIMRHIFATNIAWTFFADRKLFRLVVLVNNTGLEFITGDQPIINTYAVEDPNVELAEIEFYYPISPKLAILLSRKDTLQGKSSIVLTQEDVHSYNLMVRKYCHEQFYASDKETIEKYAK